VLDAAAFACRHPESLLLLGAVPTEAETQYGWIEPGEPVGRLRAGQVYRVCRFWEKPSADVARACLGAGAVWNTFILASRVARLAAVGHETVPELSTRLDLLATFAGTADEPWAIRQAFAQAPRASFSRDVLERVPAGLAVAPLPATVTWADWGTPERVVGTLRRAGLTPRWLEAFDGQPVHSA
jgi:mannose-1-phosphate guanylyltransferase